MHITVLGMSYATRTLCMLFNFNICISCMFVFTSFVPSSGPPLSTQSSDQDPRFGEGNTEECVWGWGGRCVGVCVGCVHVVCAVW